MVRTFKEDLARNLQNKDFASGFGSELARTDFAMLLIKARRAAGVTQQELAARAGITQAYIAKLESGLANPTIGRIGELLALLGFKLNSDLIDLKPDMQPQSKVKKDIPVLAH